MKSNYKNIKKNEIKVQIIKLKNLTVTCLIGDIFMLPIEKMYIFCSISRP